jgi:hypothetical protein
VIGKVKLDRLRPDDIQRVYRVARWEGTYPDGSSRAPLSEQTIEHIHRRIFAALRQAVQWQYIARNVAEAVIPPKPGGHERDPFTAEGVGAMLDAVEGTIDLQRARCSSSPPVSDAASYSGCGGAMSTSRELRSRSATRSRSTWSSRLRRRAPSGRSRCPRSPWASCPGTARVPEAPVVE